MEKLSKEQIVSSVNESFSSFLNVNYYDKFKNMNKRSAYRLFKKFLNDLKEVYLDIEAETCCTDISKTCYTDRSKTCEFHALNNDNVRNYCYIVYRYVLAKVVDGYLLSFVLNYEPVYNELDESKYKWYDVDRIECDLPFEISYRGMQYVYMPRLELLTDCQYIFVSCVPYNETRSESLLKKIAAMTLEYGYINAPYNDVMAKEID